MATYNINELDRDAWLRDTFPEWGTWLNEEIDAEVVPEGKLVMWWLGCTGIWFKTPGGANFTVDFWEGRGRSTKKQPPYEEIKDYIYEYYCSHLGELDYVLLAGDSDYVATNIIPKIENQVHVASDYLYSCLVGEDYNSDIFVSRFPADSTTDRSPVASGTRP